MIFLIIYIDFSTFAFFLLFLNVSLFWGFIYIISLSVVILVVIIIVAIILLENTFNSTKKKEENRKIKLNNY